MDKNSWVSWANEHWKPLFNYIPTISLLSRGWIVFVFLDPVHCTRVLDQMWRVGKGSLVLGRWHANFDPCKEKVSRRHLWVLLPQLPFPLWSKSILEGIGNTIGRFVAVEDDFLQVYDKRMARILVELDISRGLPAEVELLCEERLLIQRLDYLYVPFRCSICRSIGHLRHSCPSRFAGGDLSDASLDKIGSPAPRPPSHSHSGTVLDSSPPVEIVPDSYFEAVDSLILSHKKAVVPLSPPICALIPPPSPSPIHLDPVMSSDTTAILPECHPHSTLALDSLEDFPPLPVRPPPFGPT